MLKRIKRASKSLYKAARYEDMRAVRTLLGNYAEQIKVENPRFFKSRNSSRLDDNYEGTDFPEILTALKEYEGLTNILRRTYRWGPVSANGLFLYMIRLEEAEYDALWAECRAALVHVTQGAAYHFLMVIAAYLEWVRQDHSALLVRVNAQFYNISGVMHLDKTLRILILPLLLMKPRSFAEIESLWNDEDIGLSKPDIEVATKATLILVEGDIPPQRVEEYIQYYYPNSESYTICFLARPGDIIARYQAHFSKWENVLFPDLLVDFTGNYVARMKPVSELARILADRIIEDISDSETKPALKDRLEYYNEVLSLAADDQIYRFLRVLCALEGLMKTRNFDHSFIATLSGGYLYPALAVIRQFCSRNDIRITTIAKSASVQLRLFQTMQDALRNDLPEPVAAQEDGVNLSALKPVFRDRIGPLHLAKTELKTMSEGDIQNQIKQREDITTQAWKALFGGKKPLNKSQDITHKIILEKAQFIGFVHKPDEKWLDQAVCICANLDDRVYGPLAQRLLREYAGKRDILFYDYSPRASKKVKQLILELPVTTRMVVFNYRDVQTEFYLEFDFDKRYRNKKSDNIFEGIEKHQALSLNQTSLRRYVKDMQISLYNRVIPLHLRHAVFSEGLFYHFDVDRLVIFPTRNTYIRIVAQAARLFGISSQEIQTVLGGRMVRHRTPNTSYCSVLETWSKGYFEDYLGFPTDRLTCGGTHRYDEMIEFIQAEYPAPKLAVLRDKVLVGGLASKIITFGTQPMEINDNLRCLEVLCEALQDMDSVHLVVKLHPFEPDENMRRYRNCISDHGLRERSTITKDLNIYAIMMLSEVVIAQTSNILVEAGILNLRAIALNFGDYVPPIDFEEMGVASMIYDPKALKPLIVDILSSDDRVLDMDIRRQKLLAENPQLSDKQFIPRMLALIDSMPPPRPCPRD